MTGSQNHKYLDNWLWSQGTLIGANLPTCSVVDCVWNVMAHAQKPDFVFRQNGRVHLNRQWASVHSTTSSRGVRISGSNAGYTMFRVSVKSTGYPLHSPVFPSLPLPCVTVCHHISTGLYRRRKPIRNGLHRVHPVIQKKVRIRCFLHDNWWTTKWRKQVFELLSNICFIWSLLRKCLDAALYRCCLLCLLRPDDMTFRISLYVLGKISFLSELILGTFFYVFLT